MNKNVLGKVFLAMVVVVALFAFTIPSKVRADSGNPGDAWQQTFVQTDDQGRYEADQAQQQAQQKYNQLLSYAGQKLNGFMSDAYVQRFANAAVNTNDGYACLDEIAHIAVTAIATGGYPDVPPDFGNTCFVAISEVMDAVNSKNNSN